MKLKIKYFRFIINYHNGGFIINKEFYIMNEHIK